MGSRGNLHWNTKAVREIRKKLKFSEIQKIVLIGLILGDGCLSENMWKKSYRLQIEQENAKYDYVFWLYKIFEKWVLSPPKYLQGHRSWRFRTISHPEITEFHRIFYRHRKKIIPINIEKILTSPISLAVWFMDDGNGRKDARVYGISTHAFSRKENKFLIQCLGKNFGLKCKIHCDGKDNRIYIPRESADKFEKLILPHIIPSMKYKFPLTP